MDNKADVILLFALPGGVDALAVKFWGEDIEAAIKCASDPVHLKAELMLNAVTAFQHEGYNAFKNVHQGFEAYICVRKRFDVTTGRTIAKTFLTRVADKITADSDKGYSQ